MKEELVQRLMDIGGCGAETEWAKGFDDGVDACIEVVEDYFYFKHCKPDEIKPTNVQEFTTLTQEMSQTYEAKNADYGNSFDKSLDEFGLVASLVRMTDKLNRAKQLNHKEARVDESMRDTLMDLANYAVMTVLWMETESEE